MKLWYKILKTDLLLPLSILFILTLGWGALYNYDNKYTAGPPYGEDGVLAFSPDDLSKPIFLIDGWELYPDQLLTPGDFSPDDAFVSRETFIGQYSNFSMLSDGHSPFGSATYRLTLTSPDAPGILALYIPEIFSDYVLWGNKEVIASSGTYGVVNIEFEKRMVLVLNVTNYSHYYSGLVYPPALGSPDVIMRMSECRLLVYALLVITSFSLALFSIPLWLTRKHDLLFCHFGLLCLMFGLSCCYPFFRYLGFDSSFWYALEDSARMMVFTETVAVTAIISGYSDRTWYRGLLRPFTLAASAATFMIVAFIIPRLEYAVNMYGFLAECYRIFCWVFLVLAAGHGVNKAAPYRRFILSVCTVSGAAMFANLLDNSQFEPIYGGWQTEYSSFLLVLTFSGMMLWRNHLILKKNEEYTLHMEAMISTRTAQLEAILNERKKFFSDMAHSLKSPVASIHGFISLIREQSVCIDDELSNYLVCIERKNMETNHRIQALNTLNTFDRIHTPMVRISINQFLNLIQHSYTPDAAAAGIYLTVSIPSENGFLLAQEEKLSLMFENIIYNAISFSPSGSTVTITARLSDTTAIFMVKDMGCGILPEHLPHIFERFYTVRQHKQEGSGLGLYIARLAAEELGGTITAQSEPGFGAAFTITLPLNLI